MYLTDATTVVQCTRSQVNKCHTIRKLAVHCVRTLGLTRTRRQTSWLWYREEDGEPASSIWPTGLPPVGTEKIKTLPCTQKLHDLKQFMTHYHENNTANTKQPKVWPLYHSFNFKNCFLQSSNTLQAKWNPPVHTSHLFPSDMNRGAQIQVLLTQVTKFCAVAANTFSTFRAPFSFTCKNMQQFTNMHQAESTRHHWYSQVTPTLCVLST